MVFDQGPVTCHSDQVKINYIMGLLKGRAQALEEVFNSHMSVNGKW